MNGYGGKIARVDLSAGTVTYLPTSNYVPLYHGGRGLTGKLYWDENVPVEAAAFDPENALIFATGPTAGTINGGPRTTMACKSSEPIPECYMVSTTGGDFGPQLKFAGFDAVVIVGKSPEPCYILISDGEAKILNADQLWGLGNHATDRILRELHGARTSSMMCGPAGESMTKGGAAVINDLGHAGGNGSHASVMGSKNLKAVAAHGTQGLKVARPQALIDFFNEYVQIGSKYGGPYVIQSPAYEGYEGYSSLGYESETMADWFNWQTSEWSDYYLDRPELQAGTVRIKYAACFGCAASCQQPSLCQTPTGDETPPYDLAPPFSYGNQCHEYEYQNTLSQLAWLGMSHGRPGHWDCFMQADMGVSSHALTTDWNFFREAVDMDLITPAMTGLPTTKGNYADWNTKEFVGMKGWTYSYAHKVNDFWEKASEGRIRFLTRMHTENPANADWTYLFEKYVPYPFYHTDHRSSGNNDGYSFLYHCTNIRDQSNAPSLTSTGKTISHYATGDQVNAMKAAQQVKWGDRIGPKALRLSGMDRSWDDQVAYAIFGQDALMERECSPGCGWMGYPRFSAPFAPDLVAEPQTSAILSAVLGVDRTYLEWIDAMKPAWNIERAIHNREGRRREHDSGLSPMIFEKSTWTTKAEFEDNLTLYYEARGWDPDTAVPTRATLVAQGLTDVADGLAAAGVPII